MQNVQNSFTVENLVAKYRDYVNEHCPKEYVVGEGNDGKIADDYIPFSPDGNSDEQLLVTLYHMVCGDRAEKDILMALAQYEEKFYKDALASEELAFLCDRFQEVVSYEFEHRRDWLFHSAQQISKERVRLVHEYVKPQKGATVFIADTEYCDLAVQFPGCIVKGFTGYNYHQKEVWALGQIRMFAAGIKSEIVSGEEVDGEYKYSLPEKNSVDFVIFRVNENKYFAQHIFGTECTNIEALYKLLKPDGIMLFFSELGRIELALQRHQEIVDFRKMIVNEKAISSIVSYRDAKLLGKQDNLTNYVMLVVKNATNDKVCIKDEPGNLVKYINSQEIDDDVMWPSFYFAHRPVQGIPLSSLVDLVDEEELAIFVKGQGYILPEQAQGMLLVLSNALGENYKDANLWNKPAYNVTDPAFTESDWIDFYVVRNPCILVSGSKDNLKVGYTMQVPENGFAYSMGCCFIPKEGVDVRYVAALLFEPSVRDQILTICEGDFGRLTMSLILDKIIVPNHNDKERLHFMAEANYAAMISSQHELKLQAEDYKKSVRIRKHALTQSLSSMRSMFVALNGHRCSSNGSLKDEDKISPISTITVKDAFEFLEQKFNHMMPVVEHLADVDYSFGETKWLDPEITIENYITGKSSGWLNFKPVIDWEHGHNQADKEMKISFDGTVTLKPGQTLNSFLFPQDAFERILDNIVSNAQSHAFTDTSRTDYQLRFSWHLDGTSLVIVIDNNGTPIPSDRDTSSLLEYGVSTALNQDGHNGIGCNEIADIMERYGGNVKIVSAPNDVFTVKYVLTFEKTKLVSTFKS